MFFKPVNNKRGMEYFQTLFLAVTSFMLLVVMCISFSSQFHDFNERANEEINRFNTQLEYERGLKENGSATKDGYTDYYVPSVLRFMNNNGEIAYSFTYFDGEENIQISNFVLNNTHIIREREDYHINHYIVNEDGTSILELQDINSDNGLLSGSNTERISGML